MMHLFLSGVSFLPLFSGISYSFHEHLKPLLRRAMRIPQATHACLVLFGECWHVPHFGKILLLQLPDFWSGISCVLEILAVIIILAVVPPIVRYLSLFSNPIYSYMSGFEQSRWVLRVTSIALCILQTAVHSSVLRQSFLDNPSTGLFNHCSVPYITLTQNGTARFAICCSVSISKKPETRNRKLLGKYTFPALKQT